MCYVALLNIESYLSTINKEGTTRSDHNKSNYQRDVQPRVLSAAELQTYYNEKDIKDKRNLLL